MHVVFRESHGLEETATPTDLGQSPADLVVLSFSDSDLGAFAAGWHQGGARGRLPSLRLANLSALTHPLSVDVYTEQTLFGARAILIRLIGGVPYWAYGLSQVEALAREKGIALAVLPADGRPDPRLDEVSTLPAEVLRRLTRLCDTGGAQAARAALAELARAAGLQADSSDGAGPLPQVGAWTPEHGPTCPATALPPGDRPRILLTFYRAYLAAADLGPVEALFNAFRDRGFDVAALFAPSLKAPGAAGWLARQVRRMAPDAIVNLTAFSGRGDGAASPLDAAGVPVFQVALATSTRAAWAEADRGLSPADLAMHVVLPEVDGRIMAGVASFKDPEPRDEALQFSRHVHRPDPDRIAAIADRVAGWVRLARTRAADKRVALVLSTYPGRDWQMAHAVGLDALQSARAMLVDLAAQGYDIPADPPALETALAGDGIGWPVAAYKAALATLPQGLRDDLTAAWGPPESDPACRDGQIRFRAVQLGKALVALQPERGRPESRDDDYHDLARTPRHAYVAFYLWLRRAVGVDALVHIGAHGTLEWLPGKSVALSADCWPEALVGDLPVIYPFIVNDPGEAAQAKRRIGAMTLGHVPPPLRQSGTPDRLARLESLLDEFSNADGLDPRRRDRLQSDIRAEAQALGVEDDLGLDRATSVAEAITRIDRFVCDVKESQFGDGLHVFGRADGDDPSGSAAAERRALADALAGRWIAPGPSGSPWRGRRDVLPTGRNLYTTDPRAVPTRAAHAQGVKLAEELIRRHLQDQGDWPRGLIVDLWGSATMRTAGEEFAMALHLIGARPVWDKGAGRISGVEILPIAELDRPRIDVTLRVSGLFRDVFPTLTALFSQAVRALADRDEAPDWNPYAGRPAAARVYGPAPGSYGLGLDDPAVQLGEDARAAAGRAWLDASAWAVDGDAATRDRDGIADRVRQADAFVHLQDLPETDLLLAADYAGHEAGFAAAKAQAGGGPARLWHLDNTDPDRPRVRSLAEEIARVVRARAANPDWIAGMMRHGFRGAAEIAATLDHMAAFAQLAGVVEPHLFDLYHDATLGDDAVADFLRDANPQAFEAMQQRFRALMEAGLWTTRRNSIRAALEGRA
ncbi:cobaltochelatase subunit CobN [Jhaorihella thermophila]|uniref:Cobaltochelatase CobN n=1 Tax=Jhaorihella thermophila TaxID=488547 RepID=A0A1H5YUB1_9RHOB|nr:cobaltochelatase subunit CobN [Jhaorihella thermophila]SEG27312.1 cobaltochelatase CobN [Jhaorihella thermophila]